MQMSKIAQRAFKAAAVVSVLTLASSLTIGTATAAEPTVDTARQFLADLEENRFAFLGADNPDIVLTASDICSSDGGNGCQYLAVVNTAMPEVVTAARAQGAGQDLNEMIESFDLPNNVRAVIRTAVTEDMSGVADGEAQVTVSISDEFEFVALLHMLDFAIESTRANIDQISR